MLIDKLLQTDLNDLTARSQGEIEITRLSELTGEPFILKLRGLSTRQIREITDFNTHNNKQDNYKILLEMLVEGTLDPNFKDSRLLEKWHTPVPTDIIEKLFTPGELMKITNEISRLSGLDNISQKDLDAKIKN